MRLPSVLDLRAATPLRSEILSARGTPLALDASDVEHLGGLCLQIILAAAKSWRADGLEFQVVNPTPAFVDSLKLLGANDLLATI
jgi:chemotaxis protein CheX